MHFWSPFIQNTLPKQLLAFFSMAPIIVLGTMGLVLLLRQPGERRRFAVLALLVAASVTAPYALSQPDVRYRLALVEPFWIILAASLVDRWSQERASSSVAASDSVSRRREN